LEDNPPREPKTMVPDNFDDVDDATDVSNTARATWNEFFPDPNLQLLIEEALQNSQELNMELQEIIITRYEVMARKGEYLPRLDAGVGVGVEKVGKYTSQGAADEETGVPEHLPNFEFGFSASWEVDIWKKLRNAAKAAAKRYLATIEGRKLVVTRIVAEIANSYFELMALDNQLDVLRRNVKILRDALKVAKLQKKAAKATELAVQRFEAEVLMNKSRQYAIAQQILQTENRINFLVGRPPQPVARSSGKFKKLVPKTIHAGVPSQLMKNRPDVRKAELELEAAKLDVAVAKARFYPSLSIEADLGYEAFNPKHLIDTPESLFYNLAGNLTAPLLNRQAIKAQYLSANAAQLKAVYAYEQTVLRAYTEVANQLGNIKNLEESYELLAKQVDKLDRAVAVSKVLFRSARADYMEILMTRRDLLESELQLIETKERQLHAMVNIYLALGGGWRAPPKKASKK
jgi:NodT family efflux transporter outer membrane factor (OMF) lipoprotein